MLRFKINGEGVLSNVILKQKNQTRRSGSGSVEVPCKLRFFFDQFASCPTEQLLNEVGGINAAPKIRILHDGLLE